MQVGAAVQQAPVGPEEAFRRFENQEKEGTQMETIAKIAQDSGRTEEQVVQDIEFVLFEREVKQDLPEGEAVGMAEARVDYLLQRAAAEKQRIERIQAAAKARVQMIQNHAAEEVAKVERRLAYLESVVRLQLPGDGARFKFLYGAKSLKLPHGQVGFKQHRATVDIVDPAKALAFAQAHGLEIRVVQSVNKTPLIEHVVRTSEDPDPETDGFAFVPARDAFFLQPDLEF